MLCQCVTDCRSKYRLECVHNCPGASSGPSLPTIATLSQAARRLPVNGVSGGGSRSHAQSTSLVLYLDCRSAPLRGPCSMRKTLQLMSKKLLQYWWISCVHAGLGRSCRRNRRLSRLSTSYFNHASNPRDDSRGTKSTSQQKPLSIYRSSG